MTALAWIVLAAIATSALLCIAWEQARERDLWLALLRPTDKSGRVDEYLRRVPSKETR